MPQFTLPNIVSGGSITVTAGNLAQAQQAAANQTGVSLAQQQAGGTFGANTFGGGAGGGGGTGGSSGAVQDFGGGLAQFAAQTSGITQAQLAQQKAEFDAQLAFAKEQMEKLGIPQLQINQQLAALQQQQFQAQLAQIYGYATPGGGAPAAGTETLAAQLQAANIAAQTAGLTGWYTPPTTSAGAQAAALASLPALPQGASAGSIVRNSQNKLGEVQADGSVKQLVTQDDINNSALGKSAAAWQNIFTVPDADFTKLTSAQATMQGGQGQAQTPQQTLAGQLQQAQLSGMYQGAPTEAAREFQAQLGQQYLATAAQLQGPQNTFQLANYLRGAQGNPNVPTYIQSLANNLGLPAFQAPGSTAPTPQSAAGLLGQMGGGGGGPAFVPGRPWQGSSYATSPQWSGGARGPNVPTYTGPGIGVATNVPTMSTGGGGGFNEGFGGARVPAQGAVGGTMPGPGYNVNQGLTPVAFAGGSAYFGGGGQTPVAAGPYQTQSATPGWDYGSTLNTIQGIMGRGAQALGPGALERLSPDELQAFGSGLGAVGGSLPSFLQAYQSSRVGQQAPTGQPTLA